MHYLVGETGFVSHFGQIKGLNFRIEQTQEYVYVLDLN